MLGEGRVYIIQRAMAADASVVIQVAGDLYVSDASLAEQWTSRRTTPGECPFPGLDAFGPGQADWFFGREKPAGELLDKLDAALRPGSGGPVIVVGPSGDGKSSLLSAGLLGGLAEGRLAAAGSDTWPQLMFTPGADPLRTLRESLATCTEAADREPSRMVIVVDQIEELFTACEDEAERSEFLSELADLASGTALVVLGLRADFYARATGYPVLRSALSTRQVVLGAMSATEVRDAITRPAWAVGLRLEGGLTELLLRDLGAGEPDEYEPGRLPLLAYALRATWQRRSGDQLTIAGYEATGGIGGAIARTADSEFGKLDAAGQRAAPQVFLALVRMGEAAGGGEGEGAADTRRLVSAESLYARSSDPAAARAVVSAFTAARLLSSGEQTVQIAHEALLRRWGLLKDWIDKDRAGNLVRQELEDASAAWDQEGRDAGSLYGGIRLAAARAWAESADHSQELSASARAFLTASDRRRRRGVRRRNGVIAVLSALSVALAALAGFASSQRAAAESRYQQVNAAVEADQYDTVLSDQRPDLAMEFAVEAQRLAPGSQQAVGALLSTQAQHFAGRLEIPADVSPVLATAWSPDGALIASSTDDGYVRLWDAATYQQLWATQLTTGGGQYDVQVSSVAFSPDGRILAASAVGGVQLWNIANPRRPVSLGTLSTGDVAEKGAVLAFSPDGQMLAVAVAASSGPLIRLWNMTTRRLEGTISGGDGAPFSSIAFAGGGRVLATADDEGGVKLWDVARRSLAVVLQPPAATASLGAVAVSPDGQMIAFSGQEDAQDLYPIRLWSLPDSRLLATLAGQADPAFSLAFSHDGTVLASSDTAGAVGLWDLLDGGSLIDTLSGHAGYPVNDVAFSPRGGTLASAGMDGTVALWNTRGSTLDGHANPAVAAAFSPDGHLLAVGVNLPGAADVFLYSMPARTKVATLETGNLLVSGLTFSPGGRELAVAAYNAPLSSPSSGTIQLWNVDSRRLTGEIQTRQPASALYVAFSPDGKLLAVSSPLDPFVQLFSITSLSQVAALDTKDFPDEELPYGAYQVAFSPDGKLLAVVGRGRNSWLIDIARRTVVETMLVTGGGRSVAYSPDGHLVAIGSQTGALLTYQVTPAANPQIASYLYPDSSQPINTIAFEPDGQTLIAAGNDGTIQLWSTTGNTLEASITTGTQPILSVSYSAALGIIATATTVTRVWQTNPGQVAADICRTLRTSVSSEVWTEYLYQVPYTPVCA